MEKQSSFRNISIEKQQSFRGSPMEKQKSFRGLMEKQKSFRLAMERQLSFGGDRKRGKDSPGKRGDTPLHLAARAGNLGKVKEILLKFHDINNGGPSDLLIKQNQEGETPLYVAAENGHTRVVEEFLKHSDAEASSIPANNGLDPFHVAAKQGHLDVLKELRRCFPSLVMTTDTTNSTALHTAAALGHTEVVNLLLDTDSNLAKIARNNGKSVLHTAARMGHLEVVRALLSRDPRIAFKTDRKGQTALHMAVKGQSVDIVRELVRPDSSLLGIADNKGNTALHIATKKGRTQMVQCLISTEGIDPNPCNSTGETPLDLAQALGNPDLTTALRAAGAAPGKPRNSSKHLKQTVSDIKHDVQSQLHQTRRTGFKVRKIAKKVKKLHIEGLNNAINSATVVAVLIATVAFAAIFTVPGQFVEDPGPALGQAHVARNPAFLIFFVFDSIALFISLAVVVVQTSLVVIEHEAKKQLMSVINKLMWLACLFISIAFVSLSYIVVGSRERWLAVYATVVGGSIMTATIGSMCYCVVHQRLEDSRMSGRGGSTLSRSFSLSNLTDTEMYSERYRMYAV